MVYSYAIEQAIRAASVLHKDQVQDGRIPYPYITHLFAMAMILTDYTDDERIVVAALLHAVLEKTDYTATEIDDDFGEEVQRIVLSISKTPLEGTERTHTAVQTEEYLKRIKSAPEEGLVVVAADKIHEMRTLVEEYYENQSVLHTGNSLEEKLFEYQEISNTLNRKLKSAILAEFNSVFTEYKNFIHDAEKKNNKR